ncbi:6-phosphogluconolactonase, partial [Candidatus Peregrinibacteria bacterium]|nr:6-phosphogluconolactonase [Candidatus Peregrinibacteria bacterium]
MPSERAFVERAAECIQQKITAAEQKDGMCIVGLAGGRTPRGVYEALGVRLAHRSAKREGGCQVSGVRLWKNLHLFLVDERRVPP